MRPGPLVAVRATVISTRTQDQSMWNREFPIELKFLVSETQAERIASWASLHLALDPHAGAFRPDGYKVTSLYLDTPMLHVYHRRGSYARAKYRVRRYDESPTLFLERKCKVKGRVWKRRTEILGTELDRFLEPADTVSWNGRWFARRVEARGMVPTCVVSYDRIARIGASLNGPIRLTVDHGFLCRSAAGFDVPRLSDDRGFFTGKGVVELKYRVAMPGLFKALTREFGLSPARPSKYRAGVEGSGIFASLKEGIDA
ncbi:MAG: polyphosphate polymerase domain-containing protein [Isosphaeraceae bacterium]